MPNPIELTGFRHPITQQLLMMTDADVQAYLDFTNAFRNELRPQGMLEEQLAQSLADAQWRLNHVRALQNNVFATESAAYSETPVVKAHRSARYDNATSFSLFEHRLHRQFHQNLKLLHELQQERRQNQHTDLDKAAQILQMEKAKSSPAKPFTWSPVTDGFVFSIAEIETHIRLHHRRRDALPFAADKAEAA